MRFSGFYRNSQVFKIALGIAILVIGYIASVFYFQLQKLNDSVEIISNCNETQLELEKLLSVISMYETSLRSYIITKDESFIQNRFLNRGTIELNLNRLKKLAAHNVIRNKDLDSLNTLIDNRFKLFSRTLTIAKAKNINSLDVNAQLLESSVCTEKMRAFIYKVINREVLNIKFHNANHEFELKDSIISAFLLIVLSLLVLLLSFNKMRVDIDELKQANDELKLLNYSFNAAEKTAGFGHWKINLVTNSYTFSDNLYRLMGVAPQSFEPNLANSTPYFHPEDVEQVMKIHKESLLSAKSTALIFRYLNPNGTIRYIKGVSSFTKNNKGELVKMGVNYDISEQYLKTKKLEESNEELKSINAELESFNNIVSHDLQEPLRKVQMFISRLQENEIPLLSDQGKEYFFKIRLAANRMQTLLMDLLNYSRTIKGDKVFETVSLSNVIQQIMLDLASNIEDKKAEILIGDLPEIKVIRFQIEQLFMNLISNALKYSKDDIYPIISVAAEKITRKEMYNGKAINDADYYKIVVADNGIGFRQEYADKIFILFKRLETDAKYSGTGLGLAICKRIIDNHNGFIKVKAKPNLGAKFSIYIPKRSL
ncbi:MAG: CHASE3 domain-containing protein [Burkholderiales bacterium]|nr:CHASE3 domain-containing protein [Flavobacterium sp.]